MTLVLYAKFSEGTGTTTINDINPSQIGVLEGSTIPVWATGGPRSTYLTYNGVEGGSIIRFPESVATKISGPLSVSAWVKTNQTFPGGPTTNAQKEIITRGGGNFSFGWEEDSVEYFVWTRCYFRRPDGVYFELEWRDDNPQPGYRDNDWHNFITRFQPSTDDATSDGIAQLWIDGVLKDTEVHNLSELKISGIEDWWIVGGRKSTSTNAIDRNLVGGIAAVKIWNEYISDGTIATEATETLNTSIIGMDGFIRPSPGRHIIVES